MTLEPRCPLCGDDHPRDQCPKRAYISHGDARPVSDTDTLRADRIELVRLYLHNPRAWPDGIDLPNWREPHEVWFTGHEAEWIPLAIAAQKKLDQEEALNRPTNKRRPMLPPEPTSHFLHNAEAILKSVTKEATPTGFVTPVNRNAASKKSVTDPPQNKGGRPRKHQSAAEKQREYRARQKAKS